MFRDTVVGLCRLFFRTSYRGIENVPKQGAYIVAPVHRSFVDFGLAAGITRRRMGFMGKDSLWRNRFVGGFIGALGAYPVKRGAPDREALRRTLEFLETGEPVVLFPEGTRRSGPVVSGLHEGAAYVACRAGVPIVPVGIGGSERAMKKGRRVPRPVKVYVVVGPPIHPPVPGEGRPTARRAVHQLTDDLQKALQAAFDEAEAASSAHRSRR